MKIVPALHTHTKDLFNLSLHSARQPHCAGCNLPIVRLLPSGFKLTQSCPSAHDLRRKSIHRSLYISQPLIHEAENMDSTTPVSKVSTENEALVANKAATAPSNLSKTISTTKLSPTATFNDLPNEIVAQIVSLAITKPVTKQQPKLDKFVSKASRRSSLGPFLEEANEIWSRSDNGSKSKRKRSKRKTTPKPLIKCLRNTTTDCETADNLSKVSKHLEEHVHNACVDRVKCLEETGLQIQDETYKALDKAHLKNLLKEAECKYVLAGNGVPKDWPRKNPLDCKHCLAVYSYLTELPTMEDEVALVQQDALQLSTVFFALHERRLAANERELASCRRELQDTRAQVCLQT